MSESVVHVPGGARESLPTVGDAFVIRSVPGGADLHCAECDYRYGPARRDPKLAAVIDERSIADLSDLNAQGMVDRLVARHYFCPSCALLFAVNVQQRDDPVMLEWSLDPEFRP